MATQDIQQVQQNFKCLVYPIASITKHLYEGAKSIVQPDDAHLTLISEVLMIRSQIVNLIFDPSLGHNFKLITSN